MTLPSAKSAACRIHGAARKRATCARCNAAYMRQYLRERRHREPEFALWERARCRARRSGVGFALRQEAIVVPTKCPVLGIPIKIGGERSQNSPSLDRIRPHEGYVPNNVRVISDQANRLKSDRTYRQLLHRAETGRRKLRDDYARIAAYVDREALLIEIRQKAAVGGRVGQEWEKVAAFLEKAFQKWGETIS